MDKIEEMLKEKGNEFEHIHAPDDIEEKLREALDRSSGPKHFPLWKTLAVAAALIAAIGIGSLNFVDFGRHALTENLALHKGDVYSKNSVVSEPKSVNVTFSEPLNKSASEAKPAPEAVYGTAENGQIKIKFNKAKTASKDLQISYSENQTASSNADTNKKIIKNANARIECKKSTEAFDKILKWVKANGGYEFSRNITSDGSGRQVSAEFRIDPGKLDGLLDFLSSTGKVTDSQVSSSDITDQYQDTDARLKAMKKGRDQMMKVMDRAKTVADILKVQNELDNINANIESMQGQISLWDKQVAESSVSIVILEAKDPFKPEEKVDWKFNSPSEVLNSMKNGFINTINYIFNVLIWILVFLSSSLPVVIIGAILVFLLWRFIRKRRG